MNVPWSMIRQPASTFVTIVLANYETCARLGFFGAFWRVVALYCCGGAGRFGGCAASGRHGAHLSGCGENPGAAFDIISDGGEADLQTRLCEPSPAYASKAVASFPRSEDFFDAATNAVDRPVPSLKTRQRFRLVSTPHAGRSDAQIAALGLDGLAKVFPRYALSTNTSPGSSGRA